MKTVKSFVLLMVLFVMSTEIHAQRVVVKEEVVVGHPRRPREVVVVHSRFRPARVVVYHPFWGPRIAYQRRWVYFPRYNVYWDNWRNHYVFRSGRVWISQPAAPAVLVNVNLSKTKAVELSEKEDDTDDIYHANGVHRLQNQ